MSDYERFAIYWSPEAGSPLARWASEWLGWCADQGEPRAHPEIAGLPRPIAELTATPRRYGLHATMKAPFRLADGKSHWALEDALEHFASVTAPFEMPRLRLATDHGFVALRPESRSAALNALAAHCVQYFDGFRAPLSPAEIAKRRKAGLTPAQDAHLITWGYPYVMDAFNFHVTLTGKLDPAEAAQVASVLEPALAVLIPGPVPVREIALFGDPGDGHAFRLLHRYALTGERAARNAPTLSVSGPSLLTTVTSGPSGEA